MAWDIPDEILNLDTLIYFQSLEWGDLWCDADMVSALSYLRGCKYLQLGGWRNAFPTEL